MEKDVLKKFNNFSTLLAECLLSKYKITYLENMSKNDIMLILTNNSNKITYSSILSKFKKNFSNTISQSENLLNKVSDAEKEFDSYLDCYYCKKEMSEKEVILSMEFDVCIMEAMGKIKSKIMHY